MKHYGAQRFWSTTVDCNVGGAQLTSIPMSLSVPTLEHMPQPHAATHSDSVTDPSSVITGCSNSQHLTGMIKIFVSSKMID